VNRVQSLAFTTIIQEIDMTTAIKNQSQSIISVIAASLFMLSWAACSSQVQAADDTVVDIWRVSYADLNLNTEAGAEVLYRRLRSAADQVCMSSGSLDAGIRAAWRACYDKAMNSAVASVNKPMVTALHNRLSGISTAYTSSPTAELAAK
jgi:UrcA family protein